MEYFFQLLVQKDEVLLQTSPKKFMLHCFIDVLQHTPSIPFYHYMVSKSTLYKVHVQLVHVTFLEETMHLFVLHCFYFI